MIANVLILAVAAATSAYGVAVVLKRKPPIWAAVPAVVLYLFLGIQTVLLAWMSSAGIVLPGLQVSPGLRAYYVAEVWQGQRWGLEPALLFVALLAHLLVATARPRMAAMKGAAPATVVYLVLFLVFQAREQGAPPAYARALGPDDVVYVTTVRDDDGARILVARGAPGATFLSLLAEHETEDPPSLTPYWTKDGAGIVLQARGHRLWAIDADGNVAGALPERAHEWPGAEDTYRSPTAKRVFGEARREVAEFIQRHGGIFVR